MNELNELLNAQFNDAWHRLEIIEKYDAAINELNAELPEEKRYKKLKSRKRKAHRAVGAVIPLSIILPCVLYWIGGMAAAVCENLGFTLGTFIGVIVALFAVTLLPFVIVVPFILYSRKYCIKENIKLKAEAEKYFQEVVQPVLSKKEADIDNLLSERNEFLDKTAHVMDFLPEQYRTKLAISYMAQTLTSGRAESLKEAMNLYEEQVHRWNLEASAQRLVEEQEFQNYIVSQKLSDIADNQRRTASSLRAIENMEFYNTFCR